MDNKIKQNIPLAPFTTFKIGGEAKYFIEVRTKEDLLEAISWARENGEECFFLGGGSNILINDNGVDGLVIRFVNKETEMKGDRMVCGAGAEFSKAVNLAVANSLSGLEWAAGIPGSIGGAVRGNAGAFGSNIGTGVENVLVFNIKKEKFEMFSNKDCRFDYRYSIFKTNTDLIIWEVIFKLSKGESGLIISKVNENLGCRERRLPKLPSAGSVFKNFDINDLRKMSGELALRAENEGAVKGGFVPAGWIIEQMGVKGKTIGGAKVSLEHGNFIVNTSKARAEDVIMLISYIKQQIRDHYGVQMQEEIQYFGF
jgi:UDP-N-acetylmuramate dehydrogenase